MAKITRLHFVYNKAYGILIFSETLSHSGGHSLSAGLEKM